MANKKSAEKRSRQAIKRHLRNKSVKSSLKTAFKKLSEAVKNKDPNTNDYFNQYQALCDKASKRHIIHDRNAARNKSKASHLLKG